MSREEVSAYFKRHIELYCVTGICREAEEMAMNTMNAISALSADIKAIDRESMDEKVLIGFNMAIALFNKHLGGNAE